MRPTAASLPGGRLHLQHGPIDLVIGVDGDRAAAFAAARTRFETVLTELVEELDLLRQPVSSALRATGETARRMTEATAPHADGLTTPMAAVAGAVAETVLAAMTRAAPLSRAYVNNGGDIALHLAPGTSYTLAVAAPDGRALGTVRIDAVDKVRGVATSGQGGRSLSLGIAEAVTVLAPTAAAADVAATRIANAVDLPGHQAVRRVPADTLCDDTDLGATPVVTNVGGLSGAEARRALDAGRAVAEDIRRAGLIEGAALFLRGEAVSVGPAHLTPERIPLHA